MILCVSGYRNFNDYNFFKTNMDSLIKNLGTPELMIFGECYGVDKLALKYASENNIKYTIYYANWEKYGKSAGPIRNNLMLKNSTHLIAFLSTESKGTKQAIEYAKKNHLEIFVVNV